MKGKTPGPDAINQEMISSAYEARPDLFFAIYSLLFNIGYHPACWREATGAVLKKPNKTDYTNPKSFRVISLLNCLGKVLERIIAKRLSFLAETTNLLDRTQIGGRLRKSAVDTAIILTDEIQTNRRYNKKTSTLFLDIKGAFDHVAKNKLLDIMKSRNLPVSLLSWTKSFLSRRRLRLAFDGQIEPFEPIETGIPQGSPVSPLLFLIYIRDLFTSKACQVLSYIDDIALIASSSSLGKNMKILERETKKLYDTAAKNHVEFDLEKTELIHFTKSQESRKVKLQLPNGTQVQPKELVRWLGIWFDYKLSFKQHIAIRISQAKNAFFRMARLANIQSGLSPHAIRQLYLACVSSVIDYGSPVWWRGQAHITKELQKLQNLATRNILGVFKTAPTPVLEVEAGLLPPDVRLDDLTRKYAMRIRRSPHQHPVREKMVKNYPEDTIVKIPSQLEIAFASLQGIWPEEVENILFLKTKPWRKKPYYKVQIEKSNDNLQAEVHEAELQAEKGTKMLYAYTDASKPERGRGIGIGVVIFDLFYDKRVFQSGKNMGKNQEVYNGELEAIVSTMEIIANQENLQGYNLKVFSDSQAALQRLKDYSEKPGQLHQFRANRAAKLAKSKGILDIKFVWVPGHTNIKGNKIADLTAKKGAFDPAPDFPTSLALIKTKINQIAMDQWNSKYLEYSTKARIVNTATYSNQFQAKIQKKIIIPRETKRKIASAFYQLKIGHGYFKSYLNRIGKSESSACTCNGYVKQTPKHLLLHCRNYKSERRKMIDEMGASQPTMATLLHTKKGISLTLKFIEETRIGTRDWLLGGEGRSSATSNN